MSVAAETDAWAGPPGTIDRIETHTAVVYLTADKAYKIRKPVRFAFVDYTDPEARRAAAQAEVDLNRDLAPGVYLGVRPLVEDGGRIALGGSATVPSRRAVDHVVEMRRFAEGDTLAARLAAGRIDGPMLDRVGRRLAAFHRDAAVAPGGGAADALARVDRNLEELLALRLGAHHAEVLAAVTDGLPAAVGRYAAELESRAARGRWRDGHGDLRADHVVIEAAGLLVVDRLEFDAALRIDDVASDLAFLLMDLEARGERAAATAVLTAYRAADGDAGSDGLLACWAAYRATVVAKTAWLGARAGRRDPGRVARRLALARRLLWRARRAQVLVICGPPATGKSTLAAALAGAAGGVHLSSDVVRRERFGVAGDRRAPGEAYTFAAKTEVYVELGRRAAAVAHRGEIAVVDATMHELAERAAFRRGLGHLATAWITCTAPPLVVAGWARDRLRDPARTSDADPDLARTLAAAWTPPDEIPAADVLGLRTDRPVAGVVQLVERWLA